MQARYHLRNATLMVEFPANPDGLAAAKAFRKSDARFKRRRIRHICQALPSRVPVGRVVEMT